VSLDVVDAVEGRTRSGEAVERDDVLDVVEDGAALVALVQFEPAIAPQEVDRVSRVLVTDEPPGATRVEPVEGEDVQDPERGRDPARLSSDGTCGW
jgi:hypothetical protein